MKNGGKLKTENNVYNEAYDDGNFMFNRREKEEELIYIFISQLSVIYFLENGLWIEITIIHTGTEMELRYLKKKKTVLWPHIFISFFHSSFNIPPLCEVSTKKSIVDYIERFPFKLKKLKG